MNILEFLNDFFEFKKQFDKSHSRVKEPESARLKDMAIRNYIRNFALSVPPDAIPHVQQLCLLALSPNENELEESEVNLSDSLKEDIPNATLDGIDIQEFEQIKALCEVAFWLEKSGIAEVHAYKLTKILGDFNSTYTFLKRYYASHKSSLDDAPILAQACQLNLPEGRFSEDIWRQLAIKHLDDDRFRRLLPFADDVEALIVKQDSALNYSEIADLKRQLSETNRAWKNLNKRRSELTSAETREHDRLVQLYSTQLIMLAKAYAGTTFDERTPLQMLDAFFEWYRVNEEPTYSGMIAKGITKSKYDFFRSLKKVDNNELIPDLIVDGKQLGLEGFYLRKIPVEDEAYAVVAATLGKDTDCCMSMTGELGEPCVIHGLTDPKSGFYILCCGDANDMKPTDPILAQSWAWRPTDGKPSQTPIVFDSIEANKAFLESNARAPEIVKSFFYALTFQLIAKQVTNKVAIGTQSGIVFGYERCPDFPALEMLRNYDKYTDASKQRVLATTTSPFMLMVDGTRPEYNQMVERWLSPLITQQSHQIKDSTKSELLVYMMSFGLEHNNIRVLDFLQKLITPEQFQNLKSQCTVYRELIDNHEPDFNKAMDMIARGKFINISNHYHQSILMLAIKKNRDDIVEKLLSNSHLNLKVADQFGEIPLTLAIKRNKSYVSKLIELGADINQPGLQGETAFMQACRLENRALFDNIFEHGSINQIDEQRRHALFYALRSNDPSRVERLIQNGAKLDHKALEGETALAYCISTGRLSMAKLLLKYDLDLTYKSPKGRSYLFMCAEKGHGELVQLLIEKGAVVNGPNEKSLHISIMKRHCNIATALIYAGADVNLKDRLGNTPLMLALKTKQFDVANELIKKGADVTICNKRKQCPKDLALIVNFDLDAALRQAPKKTVFIKPESTKSMPERFVKAVEENNIRKALALLKNAKDMLISYQGKKITPLVYVSLTSHADMVRAICKLQNINGFDKDGYHVLQHVLESNNPNASGIIAILLDEGANMHAKDKQHESSMETAKRLKKIELFSQTVHEKNAKKR